MITEMIRDYKARKIVKSGAKLLDRTMGSNAWRGNVDTTRMSLHSARICVAGQVFGSFYRAPYTIREHPAFNGYPSAYIQYVIGVPRLEDAWRKELASK